MTALDQSENHRILKDHCAAVFSMTDRVLSHARKRTIEIRQVDNVWEPKLAIA